jgi:LmbE family N-acetylglucosaminyl deacetylase
LLCVLVHPDDELLGNGGILARYAAEGVETYLVTATRGERGWLGDERDYPGLEVLGKRREAELLAAAKVLGIRQTVWQAILCHESQLAVYRRLEHLSQEYQKQLWESQTYYRTFSLVNGGRQGEDDLFAGLREPPPGGDHPRRA